MKNFCITKRSFLLMVIELRLRLPLTCTVRLHSVGITSKINLIVSFPSRPCLPLILNESYTYLGGTKHVVELSYLEAQARTLPLSKALNCKHEIIFSTHRMTNVEC